MDPLPRQLEYLAQELTRMENNMIDPVDFGELRGEVNALKQQVNGIAGDVKTLLEMANKGRGGLVMFNSGLVFAGGLIAWIVDHFVMKGLK